MYIDNYKIFIKKVWLYLILIPFLIPYGPNDIIAWYKDAYTSWMELVTILMALSLVVYGINGNLKINKAICMLLIYHVVFLIITLVEQHSITNGFQKLLSTPILILYLSNELKQEFKNLLVVLGNIFLCNFTLNLLVFNGYFFKNLYSVDNHIMFLGHVQIMSILGIIGIYLGYALIKNGYNVKGKILILLSIGNMLYSQTSVSYFALLLLVLLYVLSNNKIISLFIVKHIKFIILLIFLISGYLLFLASNLQNTDFYIDFSRIFNSRPTIWNLGLLSFYKSKLLGYGAYGVQLKPYWLDWQLGATGFNYAHNTLLQLILDGGVVLAICFYIMIDICVDNIKQLTFQVKFWLYSFLIILLFIGLAESITDRVYFFIFLTLIVSSKYGNYESVVKNNEFKKIPK